MRAGPVYQPVTGIQGLDDNWSYDDTTGQIFARQDSTSTGTTYTFELRAR